MIGVAAETRRAVGPRVGTAGASVLSALLALGCAGALPVLEGGLPASSGRTDVAVGGAARIVVSEQEGDDAAPFVDDAAPTGLAPVAAVRHGFGDGIEAGALIAGTTARASIRKAVLLADDDTVRWQLFPSAAVFGGVSRDRDDEGDMGGRLGLDVPLLFGVDAGGLFELWFGPRAVLTHVWADVGESAPTSPSAASSLGLGGTVGLAVGFRRVHAMLELSALRELWLGSASTSLADATVLVPAFALRVRL